MRQGRTQSYLPDFKAGTGVGIPVPRANIVSEVRADPSAGSLAAGFASLADGFTNYFAEQTQVELAKAEASAKKQAVLDARKAYESGVTSVSSEIMEEGRGTYADAYSSALGSLKSSDAEKQFASFAIVNDLQPHEYAGARTSFYNDNFGKGTGNLNFDSAFQKSWTTNTQELTHRSSVAAAEKIKETARNSVNKTITNSALNTGTPNHFELMDQVDQVKSVYRGFTEGQAISHVFGIYQFQATQSLNGGLKYLAMLDQNILPDRSITAKQGTPGAVLPAGTTQITPRTSFSKLFPTKAMDAREKTMKILTNMKTASGQQKVLNVGSFINSLSLDIQDIRDRSDISDMGASFSAAAYMIATLENTAGVTMPGVTNVKAALSKARREYQTLMSGYATVEKLALGSSGGRPDALENYRVMETKEKEKAIRVFLGTGDFSDRNFFRKFTNAFSNFSGLEEKTPQAFLDIIRDQFSSGDERTRKGVIAFAKTLDIDGSIGATAFKNDAETATLYEQARIIGLDAAVSYADNPEYKASVNAGNEAMKKGLGVFLDPTLVKAQDKADEASDFYQRIGNDLDNQTTISEGKAPSQALKDDINKVLPILKARLEASGIIPSTDNLREAVVEYYRPRTLVGEDTVMLGIPDSQRVYAGFGPTGSLQMPLEYTRGFDLKFQNAYIGTNVKPANNDDPQDTYENMRKSVKNIRISGVDGDALAVTIGTGARTGFGVIRSSKSGGAPIILNEGQMFKNPRGPQVIGRGVNPDYMEDYTFTGDYTKDQAFVKEAFGSEYQLLPTGRGSYQLVILPFFEDIEPMEEPNVLTGQEYTGLKEERERAKSLRRINEPFPTKIEDALEGLPAQ